MPDYSNDALLFAIERFKKGEETQGDRKIIGQAIDSEQIKIIPAKDSKIIGQSGGSNFGEENEIRIAGDVTGTQIISGLTFEQALEIAKLQEKGGDNKSKIIVALIGAGGLILAAIITGLFGIGFFPLGNPSPTPTIPSPTLTATIPTPILTPTIPTPTPTNTATDTPTDPTDTPTQTPTTAVSPIPVIKGYPVFGLLLIVSCIVLATACRRFH